MTHWKKLLNSLVFSDSESAIYLASLETGPAAVQDLAKKAGVSRVTTYAVIESLTERGLMSSVEKGKKKLFVAESPERLMSYVANRVKVMEATLKEAEGSIHDLKLIQRGEKPVVKLFEGKDALKAIEDDLLQTRPERIDEFGNLDAIKALYPEADRQKFFQELKKQNPKTRAMYVAKNRPPTVRSSNEQIHVLPAEFDFIGDVMVYGNKVALSTMGGKQFSVLVESEVMAKTMKSLLDFVWSRLEKSA